MWQKQLPSHHSVTVRVAAIIALASLACLHTTQAQTTTAGDAVTAQMLKNFEQRTTVKVLPNGLTVILCERPEAPVFSFYRLVDAGSADDPGGESGLAHMFEHIAFKGTQEIGTTDWPAEKAALAEVETAYAAYDHEKRLPVGSDPAKVEELHKKFLAAVDKAQSYVIPNEFSEIAEANGTVDMNASTEEDQTEFHWSMPSNRLELWAYLESSRMKDPVSREFYKERDVVQEERRMRIDSNPVGRMVEQFLATAYVAHPYGRSGVGWESEISQVTATEADAFRKKYYTPSNMVLAIVGDFKTSELMPIIDKYFDGIPAGPKPEEMTTVEPPQFAEKSVIIREQTQPFYLEGYHRPNYRDPDDAVYDAISGILSDGRTSRLYRSLVRDQGIAAEAAGFSGFPGQKYAGLYAFYAVPLPGHTPDEMGAAIHKEIDKLKSTDVTDEELAMVKTRARANLLRGLDSNDGLAEQLATYQMRFGDWRELFKDLDKIDAVTKGDIRRVANKVFIDSNRTYAEIEFAQPKPPAAPKSAAPSTGATGNGGTK